MKLVKSSGPIWQYQLTPPEAALLEGLLKQFPFTALTPVTISRTDRSQASGERAKLLNESLAEHRRELQKLARLLLSPDKFQSQAKGVLMTLTAAEREGLLLVLNDIRVGCWQALGEPADIHAPPANEQHRGYQGLMDLTGYFESQLLPE